jgi:hypothetical protein
LLANRVMVTHGQGFRGHHPKDKTADGGRCSRYSRSLGFGLAHAAATVGVRALDIWTPRDGMFNLQALWLVAATCHPSTERS